MVGRADRFRVLGSSFTSCSSIKKGNDLPVVGKSVALFDYFNYKGEDDVYISNPLPGDDYFIIPFCRDGIPIPAFAPMAKAIIFWLFPPLLIIRVCLFPQQRLGELEAGRAYLESSFSISQHGGQHVSGGILLRPYPTTRITRLIIWLLPM